MTEFHIQRSIEQSIATRRSDIWLRGICIHTCIVFSAV